MDSIYIALSQTQWPPKRFTFATHSPIHSLIHTPTAGAAGVRCLAHGHLDTWSGGTGDWTTNLLVCRQPTWTTAALI